MKTRHPIHLYHPIHTAVNSKWIWKITTVELLWYQFWYQILAVTTSKPRKSGDRLFLVLWIYFVDPEILRGFPLGICGMGWLRLVGSIKL